MKEAFEDADKPTMIQCRLTLFMKWQWIKILLYIFFLLVISSFHLLCNWRFYNPRETLKSVFLQQWTILVQWTSRNTFKYGKLSTM